MKSVLLPEPHRFDPTTSQSGVSLIELALLLPLVIILIAGIIDYGFALREIQGISSAAREGARIAASHARRYATARCSDPAATLAAIRCDAKSADALRIVPADSVSAAGKKATCQSLRNAKLSPGQWNVEASVTPQVEEDGTKFDTVTIKIEKDQKAKNCLICWDKMLEALKPNSESVFALESKCAP